MKFLILLLAFGCTQKYADYDLIQKSTFNKESYERPITLMQVIPDGVDKLETCFGQWLFFSNAEKEKNEAIPMNVRMLCPGKDFLVNTTMTETWWTTLFYTRACVEIVTSCGERKKH